jgi:hypothetical protein
MTATAGCREDDAASVDECVWSRQAAWPDQFLSRLREFLNGLKKRSTNVAVLGGQNVERDGRPPREQSFLRWPIWPAGAG